MSTNHKLTKTLAVLLSVAFVLSGCATVGSKEGTEDRSSLTVAITGRPSTMDPVKAGDTTSVLSIALYEETFYRLDSDGEYVPALATGYDTSPDGKKVTLHLRDGLRYSNGEPIKAIDFVNSFRRVADPMEASDAIRLIQENCKVKNVNEVFAGKFPVEKLGVSAPDDKTVVIELDEPCPRIEGIIASQQFSPCPKRFIDGCNGHFASNPETMLSSGAFFVDRYQTLGTQIHYKKNPYYYDADSVKLEEVTYQCVSDAQQAVMCYQTGTVDMTKVDGEFISLAAGDASLQKNLSGIIDFIPINEKSKNKACQNVNMRMALANAIDRGGICEKLMYDAAKPLTRLVPTDIQKTKDGKDLGADEEKYSDICSYNPDKAKEYFEKATKELGTDQFTFKVITRPKDSKLIEVLTDGWKKTFPSMSFDIRMMPDAKFYEEIMGEDYDITGIGLTCDKSELISTLQILRTDNAMNMPGYSNPDLDKRVDAAQKELDVGKLCKLITEAEEIAMKDMPIIPLCSSGTSWLVAESVKGFKAPGDGIIDVTRVYKE